MNWVVWGNELGGIDPDLAVHRDGRDQAVEIAGAEIDRVVADATLDGNRCARRGGIDVDRVGASEAQDVQLLHRAKGNRPASRSTRSVGPCGMSALAGPCRIPKAAPALSQDKSHMISPPIGEPFRG